MKDRIVFFVLGAVLATVAYFAGDMDKAGAQEDVKVFDGDVIINGLLSVNSGKMAIKYDPLNLSEADKIPSAIVFLSNEDITAIELINGPRNNRRGKFPSKMVLMAATEDSGTEHYSAISLSGNYNEDFHMLTSDSGLVKVK